MARAPFEGVGVALVTLFDADGGVLAKDTAEHAVRLVDRGIQAVVVAGTTGEAATLDDAERDELIRAVRAAVRAGVPVLAGTGAPSARQAARLTARAREAGADGFLALSPPGAADPRPYYAAVAEAAGDLPVLAYHIPAVSPPGIRVEHLPDLPVAGLKDSTGDPDRLLEELDVFPGALYVGAASVLALAGPLGCAGAILALANVDPEGCIAAFAGDAGAQRGLAPAHLATRRGGIAGLKSLLAEGSGTPETTRTHR
jgi:4-hydroxy-tetrahydrodipicolinate synthase